MGNTVSYYHLPTDTERHPGRLETKLADGARLGPPDTGWTPELAAMCGFVRVTPGVRPDDTATHTSVRGLIVDAPYVIEVWTAREWTADELAARNAPDRRAELIAQIEQATTLTKLRAAVLAAIDTGII